MLFILKYNVMLNIQDFISKCKAFGFNDEMLNKCDAYYRGCRTAKRKEVIESSDSKFISTNVNRWCSLQGVTRKPRKPKDENNIEYHINMINSMIPTSTSYQLNDLVKMLQASISLANKQITNNKDKDRKRLEDMINELQKELDELNKPKEHS